MAALDTPRPIPPADDVAVSVAAQLCWQAFQICQAMAASLDSLQDDLAEISGHCDSLIEMALDLDRRSAEADAPPAGSRR